VNPPTAADVESELVDLADLTLADLPELDAAVIAPVMGRLLRRVDDPDSITSGYNPQRLD
jgi:FXSXX-COOH protein